MTTSAGSRDDRGDPVLSAIMSERHRLINLAYRLLGSLADAEDVVQETYVRWYAMSAREQQAIESPGGWLVTVASRICLNVLGSARARRETYVGDWIPEPLPEPTEWITGRSGGGVDPADRVTLDESVTMAFLVVLDSMTPAERTAFVLHDVFRYPFGEVAEIVGRTPAACRQLASSARRRIRLAQTPTGPSAGQSAIIKRFKTAWQAKDIDALISLLDPEATATADGGGLVVTHLHPIIGGERIARAYAEIARVSGDRTTFIECTVNGLPGLVARQDGNLATVFAFEIADDRIRHIWAIRNPEKLGAWRPWPLHAGLGARDRAAVIHHRAAGRATHQSVPRVRRGQRRRGQRATARPHQGTPRRFARLARGPGTGTDHHRVRRLKRGPQARPRADGGAGRRGDHAGRRLSGGSVAGARPHAGRRY